MFRISWSPQFIMVFEIKEKNGDILKFPAETKEQIGDLISDFLADKYNVTEDVKADSLKELREMASNV